MNANLLKHFIEIETQIEISRTNYSLFLVDESQKKKIEKNERKLFARESILFE